MSTKSNSLPSDRFSFSPTDLIGGALGRLLQWQERAAERQHLGNLNDYELRDLGLSRADISQEAAKPFWRA